MPIYELRCTSDACGKRFERITPRVTTEREHAPCDCGAPVERVYSAGIKTKGFEPYYDIGLGVYAQGSGDLKQAMRRANADRIDPMSKGDRSARLDRIHEQKRGDRRVHV